jgi:UDP-N-acetylmuramoylalanine--D-glutamate ligase
MVKFQEQTEIQNENYPQDIVQNTEEEIVDTEDILIPGRHNWENVCAAVMAASLAGVSKKSIVQAIKTFKGLEHRLELVRTVRGVLYYDDSIATNPESALAGIQAFKQPKILILGGVTEGSDFEQLGTYISLDPSIKAIIGIGKEWPTIKLKIQNSKFKIIEDCKNMQEVVNAAAEVAEAGDVVLLSPACKSFDMFTSYKDRGEQFKKAVHAL